MISYNGYEDTINRVYDNNQEHVFKFWDELTDAEKKSLLDELSDIDFQHLMSLYEKTKEDEPLPMDFQPAPYMPVPQTDAQKEEYTRAYDVGTEFIKHGKVAAFVVAGGQGSRLGFDGPKGAFPVGPVSDKTLFQIHAEKIKKYAEKYGVIVPWLIMTSPANHQDTVDFLKEHNWFGLHEESVHLFPQKMIPSLDPDGKLVLADKHSIFKNPDGHGGSLTALRQSGVLEKMIEQGIQIISYFQVDNPLVNIVDPYFIGFHVLQKAHISSKALMKAYPEEKVGVFVEFENGKIGVVEYSDLPEEKQYEKDNEGSLRYAAGSIAIHLFDCRFLMDITGGGSLSLPYHIAKKKIEEYTREGEKEIQGFKFEKFVFDALPLTDNNFIMETTREEEFAPVKNKSGVDSVESARELMSNLAMNWLKQQGISIPQEVKVIEISPLQAVEPGDIDNHITIPAKEKVYIQ